MTALAQLEQKADELRDNSSNDELDEKIDKIRGHLDNDLYSVAKIWKTTPVVKDNSLSDSTRMDAITLLYTSVSERELAEMVYEDLRGISNTTVVNKAVKVNVDDQKLNVVPTKFAQQGTIELGEAKYPKFAEIVGEGELLQQASVLLQKWQKEAGLDDETEVLLPFEIELTLSHIIKEYEPEDLEELISMFFKFGEKERFATQLNIFDKTGNILLYHDFIIPEKQDFLVKLFEANERYNQDERDLSIFGIN